MDIEKWKAKCEKFGYIKSMRDDYNGAYKIDEITLDTDIALNRFTMVDNYGTLYIDWEHKDYIFITKKKARELGCLD